MNWKLAREIEADMGPMDLHQANLAQRRNLLQAAAPRDLEDLLPILQAKVAQTKAAYDRASQELADCLLTIQERKHG